MTTTTTTTETKTVSTTSFPKPKVLTSNASMPSLLTKAITSTDTPSIAVPSVACPISPIAAGSFYLPIKQKNKRNGRYHHKHLRKPPSFDTYLTYSNSSTTTATYNMTRTSSVSSSYSSSSSLADNEDMIYGYGGFSKSSVHLSSHYPRLRRGSSGYKVRFAEDDGSSIVSSSSGGSDEWDDLEEEDYIPSQQQYYNYHDKSNST